MNKLLALVAGFALSGCWAYGDPVYWWKPGVTEAEAQKDEDECVRTTRNQPAGSSHECMDSRGYRMMLGTKPDYAK